jgi:hypothetical protein
MPSLAEIRRALYGAWRLLLVDPRGLAFFDGSPLGALRSFWSVLFVVPLALAIQAVHDLAPSNETPAAHNAVVDYAGPFVAWLLLLLVIYCLVGWYGRGERFWLFVSTYNWAQIPQSIGLLGVAALLAGASSLVDFNAPGSASTAEALIGGLAFLTMLALYVAVFAYEWYMAWLSLDAGIALPTIVVLLDFVLSLALSRLSTALA